MDERNRTRVRGYAHRRRQRYVWRNIVRVMACIVVFVTTYALILPAITLEADTFCGLEAHSHTQACYSGGPAIVCDPAEGTDIPVIHAHDTLCYDGENLLCTLPELAAHVHTEGCYETVVTEAHVHDDSCKGLVRGTLLCEAAESQGHTHGADCYAPGDTLTCTEPVREGHTHGDACYKTESQLTCQTPEGEGHAHGDDCYKIESQQTCQLPEDGNHTHSETCFAEAKTLTCTTAEVPAHTHDEGCHTQVRTLICETPEDPGHAHAAGCYEQVLNCGLEEAEGHSHTDDCYEMAEGLVCGKEELPEPVPETKRICGLTQIAPHTHHEACYDESGSLICDITPAIQHQHEETCVQAVAMTEENLICELEVHEHTLSCFSDPNADVETAADWETSFGGIELTGIWREDVLAIAKTQLGYRESTKNYIVGDDGVSTKGYTRYGAWYGAPYGDWCAMYASFCIDYAGVKGMPLDANCPNWINTLRSRNLYHVSGGYGPQGGDLIFFDWNADGSSDHVGIVVETDGEIVKTIEGNSGDTVRYNEYRMDDSTIQGYGALPAQLTEAQQAQVDKVIALIEAMPSADEIDAKIAEFEEAGDYQGQEAWLEEVYQQVAEAYYYYDQLSQEQKFYVTNAGKLLELEYIWSVTTYSSVITSASPTKAPYTSTSEFIELNLYDYNYAINQWWFNNKKYPGFQWNGGAYSKPGNRDEISSVGRGVPNYTTDRHVVDSIDFGNSMITNFNYGETKDYVKSVNSIGVGKLYNNDSAADTGKINWLWYDGSDYGTTTNRPVGMSTGYQSLSNNLENGYPALLDGTSLSYLFGDDAADEHNAVTKVNTQSIDGLFYQNPLSGAFAYNSRENHAQYSNNFFTRYNQIITPNFIVYPFGNFLPFNSITDLDDATQVGAFNYAGGMEDYVEAVKTDLRADMNATGSEDWKYTTRSQLLTMLDEYAENWDLDSNTSWSSISPANAIRDYFTGDGDNPSDNVDFVTEAHLDKMYNIDWDVDTNFFFGMEMKMNIMQPKDGLTGYDNGDNTKAWAYKDGTPYRTGEPDGIPDYPMVFNFTGDDDVWVYVDGMLFLDLTGIHRHVGGRIDFQTGRVQYFELSPSDTGDVKETAYAWYSFAELMRQAGKSDEEIDAVLKPADSDGNRPFKDYTTHTFNFYYMERGSGSSVCRMNFNFPLLQEKTISVQKENTTVNADGSAADVQVLGNPDYYFNIVTSNNELFVGPGSVTDISQYKVKDADGNILKNADGTDKVFTTDQYGIFTLKAGQTAVFAGIEENEGIYFVQELIKEEDNPQYPTVEVNDEVTRYNQLIDWSYRTYFSDSDDDNYTGPYGFKWYGRSGYNTDASTNSAFYFDQQNQVDVSKLGKLAITKEIQSYAAPLADTYYKMYVALDGEPLPMGLKYTVGEETRTVEQAGYIEIAAGETAVISNIISGTKFHVIEDSASAKGYTVGYSADNAYNVSTADGGISGQIHIGANNTTAPLVTVTVINAEEGDTVTIPVTKSYRVADSTSRSFTFKLEQVADANGTPLSPSGETMEDTITLPDEDKLNFQLSYFSSQFEEGTHTFYYKITETGATEDTLENTQAFIAEVTVTKASGSEKLDADVKLYPLGNPTEVVTEADFVNTITGSLKLEKIVDGGTQARENGSFDFTIALEKGSSGVELAASYPATLISADGTTTPTNAPVTDGVIRVTKVKHNESVVIHGLPIGTQWTITETGADGYTVKTTVTVNGGDSTAGTGVTTEGEIVTGTTQVVYTNQQGYALPETGGTGIYLYTMAGLLLMLTGTAYLLYKYKKRGKEVC